MNHAILLISCPDQKGITASVTDFIFSHNGNIVHADQHIDGQSNTFFMRVEWALKDFALERAQIPEKFSPLAEKFTMTWDLHFMDRRQRVAILVSKPLHCLQDLILRQKAGQLRCDIPFVISNHGDAASVAQSFGVRFLEFPMTPQNKEQQEAEQIKLLEESQIDCIVLARYHQILSPRFVKTFENRIINIHHSFLPAFAGKNPYAQAYEKGVKIIGATSHFVTEQLDQGPIIEQDTVRISHRDSLEDLVIKGQDLEKVVLSRAVRWFLDRKILCYGNKTVIFD